MTQKLKALVIGAGERGHALKSNSELIDIKAIADINPIRRDSFAERYNIPKEMTFSEGKEPLNKRLDVDFVYVATDDRSHRDLAVTALENGYNLLLEKPMASNPEGCIDIVKAHKKSGKIMSVFHVLRYAPFFQGIKKEIVSKNIGDVEQIDLTEEVGYWHFAHSYVRGNWKNEDESGPIILTKSCHDLDLLVWLSESKPEAVSSKGSLKFFRKENAPAGALERCTDGCPINKCLYDAREFYFSGDPTKFPFKNVCIGSQTKGSLKKAIQTGTYGVCVFNGDNDVLDNQEVNVMFENGVEANFSLRRGGPDMTRKIRVYGTHGMLDGELISGELTKTIYSGKKGGDKIEHLSFGNLGGHGGGDPLLVREFIEAVRTGKPTLTSPEESLYSHLTAFAAEESRKSGRTVLFNDYLKSL